MPRQWKYEPINVLHKRKDRTERGSNLVVFLVAQSHRGLHEGLLRARKHVVGETVWVQTPTLDGGHDARSTTISETVADDVQFLELVPHRPHQLI